MRLLQVSSGGLGLFDAKQNMKELRKKLVREFPAPGESSRIIVKATSIAAKAKPPFGLQFTDEELDSIKRSLAARASDTDSDNSE